MTYTVTMDILFKYITVKMLESRNVANFIKVPSVVGYRFITFNPAGGGATGWRHLLLSEVVITSFHICTCDHTSGTNTTSQDKSRVSLINFNHGLQWNPCIMDTIWNQSFGKVFLTQGLLVYFQ